MPSPKTSGEVIQAQRATVVSEDYKPPLPPKSGYEWVYYGDNLILNYEYSYCIGVFNEKNDNVILFFRLFKPHSGIIVNKEKSFVPDVVHIPGPRKVR